MADDIDEPICRYCFSNDPEDGELISPCDCSGGQAYVHLSCLRRWQRMVLVSQPTHPAFYDKDPRHYTCNVCNGKFTCAPPTRLELMASFTGPELGALIDVGCIIGAHEVFSAELARQVADMPEVLVERSSYRCWIGGAYLITKVEQADATLPLSIDSAAELAVVRHRLGDHLTLSHRDATLRLSAAGSLAHLATPGSDEQPSTAAIGAALDALGDADTYPIELKFVLDPPPGCAADTCFTSLYFTHLLTLQPIITPPSRNEHTRGTHVVIMLQSSGAARTTSLPSCDYVIIMM